MKAENSGVFLNKIVFSNIGCQIRMKTCAKCRKIGMRLIMPKKIVIFIKKNLHDYKNSHIFVVKD